MIRAGWRLVVARIDFGPGEGHAHRSAGLQRGEAEQRLDREVELGAEAAADRRGQDAHALGRQAEDAAVSSRSMCGAWVQARMTRVSPSSQAAPASGSIGACSTKGVSIVAVATWALVASAAAASPRRTRPSVRRLSGRSRWTAGASAASADVGLARAGSGVQWTGKPERSSSGSSRATRATGSPWKRVSVSASAGWSAKRGMTPKRLRPGMSSAVRTAATPGRAAAQPARSPKAKPARGCGERMARERQGVGGHGVGAEAFGAVDLGAAVEARQAGADRGAGGREVGQRGGAGVADGGDDPAVAGAAAEDAAEGVGDLGLGRVRGAGEEGAGGEQHARGAGAALGGAVAQEGGLQGGEGGAGEALDGGDAAAGGAGGGGQAGADRVAVEEHGAGAAVAGVAADLGAGEAGCLAEEVGEAAGRGGLEAGRAAVEGEAQRRAVVGHRRGPARAATARRSSSVAASAR